MEHTVENWPTAAVWIVFIMASAAIMIAWILGRDE